MNAPVPKHGRNILRKLKFCIIVVLLATLALGTTGFMIYFRGLFAKNLLGGVAVVTDSINEKLKTRESEFAARQRALESDYLARLNHDIAILQQTAPNALWNVEQESAELIINAFLEKEEITAIRVDDETGKLFAAMLKQGGQIQSARDDTNFRPQGKLLSADLTKSGKKIGTVRLYYSEAPLQRQLATVASDLDRFRKENQSLVASIEQNLGATIESQASRILLLRFVEMVAVFAMITVTLTLFIRFKVVKPLGAMLNALTESSDTMQVAAHQVANEAGVVAEVTSREAASIEETSATVEELSSMTQRNAEHAHETDRLMNETRATVDETNRSMRSLFDSIQEIRKSSAETSKIVNTIEAISFQTNLLALNAAVEAARAGEHGAGFAVVADEVRSLARRAAEAAKETSSLIENTNRQVAGAGTLVEDSRQRFDAVNERIQRSSNYVAEIAHASAEQARGIEQLKSAIGEIDKVIQQTVTSADHSAAASQQMSAQSQEMNNVMEDLRLLVGLQRSALLEKGRPEQPMNGVAHSPRHFSAHTGGSGVRSVPEPVATH
jgi:methyl-accepting chemotaxis protein